VGSVACCDIFSTAHVFCAVREFALCQKIFVQIKIVRICNHLCCKFAMSVWKSHFLPRPLFIHDAAAWELYRKFRPQKSSHLSDQNLRFPSPFSVFKLAADIFTRVTLNIQKTISWIRTGPLRPSYPDRLWSVSMTKFLYSGWV